MSNAVAALLLMGVVIFLYGALRLFKKYPSLIDYIPFFQWAIEIIKDSIAYWSFRRDYSDIAATLQKATLLAGTIALRNEDPKRARREVRALVNTLHSSIHPKHTKNLMDVDYAVATYMLLLSREEILDIIEDIKNQHKSLDVKKATNLAIDVAGEIVSLKDDLGQRYFQRLILGINKSLILIRDKGTDTKALKKITSTLYRTYKVTKAYRYQRGLHNLSEAELYEKIFRLFTGLNSLQS